jgi:hypothetical protein
MGVATGVAPILTAIGNTATFADPATMIGAVEVGAAMTADAAAGAVVIAIAMTMATAAIDTDAALTPIATAEKGMSADPATSDPA